MSSSGAYLLNCLFIFFLGSQPVCCCLFPGHRKKRPGNSERGFFLVHLKNSSIVLRRSPHCCRKRVTELEENTPHQHRQPVCCSESVCGATRHYTTALKHTVSCFMGYIRPITVLMLCLRATLQLHLRYIVRTLQRSVWGERPSFRVRGSQSGRKTCTSACLFNVTFYSFWYYTLVWVAGQEEVNNQTSTVRGLTC